METSDTQDHINQIDKVLRYYKNSKVYRYSDDGNTNTLIYHGIYLLYWYLVLQPRYLINIKQEE